MFTLILTSLQCHLNKDNGLEIVPKLQNNLFTMAVDQLLTKGEYKTMSFIAKIAKLMDKKAAFCFVLNVAKFA